MRHVRAWSSFAVAAIACLAAGAGSAAAQGDVDPDIGDQIVITGDVVIPEDTVASDVVVAEGSARIEGRVRGSVIVLDGVIVVSGQVADNVVIFNGPVTLQAGARVGGDLISRRAPNVAEGAVVEGTTRRVSALDFPDFGIAAKIGSWIAFTVMSLLLGLVLVGLGRRAMESAAVAGRSIGPSLGWGVLLLIGLPIVGVLLLVTIVGIPLGLALLLALWLLYSIGYVVGAFVIGRRIVKPPAGRFAAFFAGWAILRGLAFIPVVAGIAALLVTMLGMGAVLVAAWRGRRDAVPPTPGVYTPPPAPVPTA